MSTKAKKIDLGRDKIGGLIVRLAIPAVVAQVINLLYNLVDRMYVSAIPGEAGTLAIAGLGVVFPITLIVSAFANLVGLGGAPLASIFLGEKKREEASRVFHTGAVMLVLFGVVLTAAVLIFCEPLVRAFGAPSKAVPYGSSYLFIYLSPFIMSVTESAIQIVFNINLKLWSGDNEYYTAALTIMLSAVQMVCMPLNGLGNGVQPIVSYNYGTGDSARIRKTVKITAVIALCGSVSVWLLSLLAPQVYGYMFNASPEVMALLRRYTPFFMMGTVMFFAQMTLQNVFIALNQAKISIFLACLRKVILLIPLCFLLPYAFGVSGVFYSEGIADLIAGIITAATFFGMLPRILKKREGVVRQENSVSVGEAR